MRGLLHGSFKEMDSWSVGEEGSVDEGTWHVARVPLEQLTRTGRVGKSYEHKFLTHPELVIPLELM